MFLVIHALYALLNRNKHILIHNSVLHVIYIIKFKKTNKCILMK